MRQKGFVRLPFLVLIFAHTTAAVGQSPVSFEFGIRAGVPLMKNLRPSTFTCCGAISISTSEKPLYTVGPTFGAILYDRISVQFEALYKPVESRFSLFPSSSTFTSSSTSRGSSWEFPLLFNYRFLRGPMRPYGGVGIVVGEMVSTVSESQTKNSITGTETHSQGADSRFFGQVPASIVDAGFEWTISYLIVRPEVRFSRWSHNQPNVAFRSAKQFEFLIGFSFRGFPSSPK